MAESDQALMRLIHDQYDATIRQVGKAASVPPAFLAALIANESGGNPAVKRFEPNVLTQLWAVFMGRKAAFGSIGLTDLIDYVVADGGAGQAPPWTGALQSIDRLATSWGLTQIMGYNAIELSTSIGKLQTADGNLAAAIRLVTQFAARYSLDYDSDAGDLLRCWNTGRPDGTTFDPSYVPNGLARLQLYEGIV